MKAIVVMKTLLLCLALALAALASTTAAIAGQITGVVKPQGLRSPQNILVYLARAPRVKLDLSRARFVMDQRNLSFIPHILPVPVGARVSFPNNDKVNHNVFSLSLARKFNLGSYPPGSAKTVTFDRPGVVELRCDVHQDMRAYILVLKSPYYAVTDAQGRFTIPDPKFLAGQGLGPVPELPAGKYLVKTWHEKLRGARALVEVPARGTANITLSPRRGSPGVLYKR